MAAAASWIGARPGPSWPGSTSTIPTRPTIRRRPSARPLTGGPTRARSRMPTRRRAACWPRGARARGRTGLLVPVTADHGEALGEHGERTHGFFIYRPRCACRSSLPGRACRAARARGPGTQRGHPADAAGRLGLTPPAGLPGVDLLRERAAREAYAETLYPRRFGWAPLRALRRGRCKLIDAPRPELYDLSDDPRRDAEPPRGRGRRVERLRAALAAVLAPGEREAAARPADAATAERLRALGYVAARAARRCRRGGGRTRRTRCRRPRLEEANWAAARGDTRPRCPGCAPCGRGARQRRVPSRLSASLRRAGRAREAAELVGLRRAEDDRLSWHERALALAEAGQLDEAMRASDGARAEPAAAGGAQPPRRASGAAGRLDEALGGSTGVSASIPTTRACTNRANVLRAMGRAADARGVRSRGARTDDADALNGLGVLAVQAGRADEAVPLFRRALALDPAARGGTTQPGGAPAQAGRREAALPSWNRSCARRRRPTRPGPAAAARAQGPQSLRPSQRNSNRLGFESLVGPIDPSRQRFSVSSHGIALARAQALRTPGPCTRPWPAIATGKHHLRRLATAQGGRRMKNVTPFRGASRCWRCWRAGPAFAQGTTGAIEGNVTDEQGLALPGATSRRRTRRRASPEGPPRTRRASYRCRAPGRNV